MGGSSFRKTSVKRTAPKGRDTPSLHFARLADNELRATSADIDDKNTAFRMRPARLDPEIDEPSFLWLLR